MKKTVNKPKKKIRTFFIVGFVVVFAIIIAVGVMYLGEVNIRENARVEVYSNFDGYESHSNLSPEESKIVLELIKSKKIQADDGQFCDYSEDNYISVHEGKNAKNFYFGCNRCPALHYKNKVVVLDENDYDYLQSIVGEYGVHLPMCEKSIE